MFTKLCLILFLLSYLSACLLLYLNRCILFVCRVSNMSQFHIQPHHVRYNALVRGCNWGYNVVRRPSGYFAESSVLCKFNFDDLDDSSINYNNRLHKRSWLPRSLSRLLRFTNLLRDHGGDDDRCSFVERWTRCNSKWFLGIKIPHRHRHCNRSFLHKRRRIRTLDDVSWFYVIYNNLLMLLAFTGGSE